MELGRRVRELADHDVDDPALHAPLTLHEDPDGTLHGDPRCARRGRERRSVERHLAPHQVEDTCKKCGGDALPPDLRDLLLAGERLREIQDAAAEPPPQAETAAGALERVQEYSDELQAPEFTHPSLKSWREDVLHALTRRGENITAKARSRENQERILHEEALKHLQNQAVEHPLPAETNAGLSQDREHLGTGLQEESLHTYTNARRRGDEEAARNAVHDLLSEETQRAGAGTPKETLQEAADLLSEHWEKRLEATKSLPWHLVLLSEKELGDTTDLVAPHTLREEGKRTYAHLPQVVLEALRSDRHHRYSVLEDVRLGETDTPDVAETAACIHDPGGSTSLEEAAEAARTVHRK